MKEDEHYYSIMAILSLLISLVCNDGGKIIFIFLAIYYMLMKVITVGKTDPLFKKKDRK